MATYLNFENKIEKIQEEIISAHDIANLDSVNKYQEELEKVRLVKILKKLKKN